MPCTHWQVKRVTDDLWPTIGGVTTVTANGTNSAPADCRQDMENTRSHIGILGTAVGGLPVGMKNIPANKLTRTTCKLLPRPNGHLPSVHTRLSDIGFSKFKSWKKQRRNGYPAHAAIAPTHDPCARQLHSKTGDRAYRFNCICGYNNKGASQYRELSATGVRV